MLFRRSWRTNSSPYLGLFVPDLIDKMALFPIFRFLKSFVFYTTLTFTFLWMQVLFPFTLCHWLSNFFSETNRTNLYALTLDNNSSINFCFFPLRFIHIGFEISSKLLATRNLSFSLHHFLLSRIVSLSWYCRNKTFFHLFRLITITINNSGKYNSKQPYY